MSKDVTPVFRQEIEHRAAGIEQMIRRLLPKEEGEQSTVLKAMNYSMLAGGKRIRPMLLLETYTLYGGDTIELAEYFAAALEMIHTHSLIHDDLPALDNDRYRRGRETTHVVYGEAMAILAGDALLNYAYETALRSASVYPVSLPRIGEALRVLSAKTGAYGMLGGQCIDVENDGRAVSANQLERIYALKTGALLEAPLMCGGILAGASVEDVRILEDIGHAVGMAFQIQDDILDTVGDEALLGKPVHSDEKNHKTTWVSLYGMDRARQDVKQLTESALAKIDELALKKDAAFMRQLLAYLAGRQM